MENGIPQIMDAVERGQFHQHFTCAFCANIFAPKKFKPKTQLSNFWHQNFVQKTRTKTLMKFTAGGHYSEEVLLA